MSEGKVTPEMTAPAGDASAQAARPETAKQKYEREQVSRRQALRRLGYTSALAAFALFNADDVLRLVGKRLAQRAGDNQVAETVARELQHAGIAMAGLASGKPCTQPCASCGTTFAQQTGNVQACQQACNNCCYPTSGTLPCGVRADADVNACQTECANYFNSGV